MISAAQSIVDRRDTRAPRSPIVRPISQVILTLTDTEAFSAAVRASVGWLASPKRCAGSISQAAFEGKPFDLSDQPAANPTIAVRIEDGARRVWAAEQRFPDATTAQRTWVTEIVVLESDGEVAFATRLTNVTRGQDGHFSPSVPGVVREVVSRLSPEVDGVPVTDEVHRFSKRDSHDLVGLLSNKQRRLPLLVLSRDEGGRCLVDPQTVRSRLQGAAHVFEVDSDAAWELTRSLGKWWSVFGGALRLYWPGFDPDIDDPYDHPLRLYRPNEDGEELAGYLARHILPRSFSMRSDRPIPRFADIREAAAAADRHRVSPSIEPASLAERVHDLEAALERIEHQREEDAEAQEQLLGEAEAARLEAEQARNELRSENDRLRARIANFKDAARIPTQQDERLRSYEDLASWADRNLGDGVEFLDRALRAATKHGTPEMLGKIEETLLLIRDFYLPMRREGGAEKRTAFDEACARAGVVEDACFSQRGAIKGFPEYRTRYRGCQIDLDRHFKYGTSSDLRRSFRLYFHYDEDTQAVVVGHMPTHLDNKLTANR